MSDQLERSVREALSYRDAQLDQDAIDRLRAVDYKPRQRRIRRLPAVGALGTVGGAGIVAAVVSLSAGAAPAFAGWQATPTTPSSGQLAQAAQACGQGLGTPVLTDSRGPYTASIYSESNTTDVCLSGNDVTMSSSFTSAQAAPTLSPGSITLNGGATRDAAGNALTLADGRAASDVTAVTIELSDGSTVQATVSGGWYMAWWPGDTTAKDAVITSSSGTSTVPFPAAPSGPSCPTGAICSNGFGSGSGAGSGETSVTETGGSTGFSSVKVSKRAH